MARRHLVVMASQFRIGAKEKEFFENIYLGLIKYLKVARY